MKALRGLSLREIALLLADGAAGVETSKSSPRRLKPDFYCGAFGMTEVMTSQSSKRRVRVACDSNLAL